jgi:hypothetical protein
MKTEDLKEKKMGKIRASTENEYTYLLMLQIELVRDLTQS